MAWIRLTAVSLFCGLFLFACSSPKTQKLIDDAKSAASDAADQAKQKAQDAAAQAAQAATDGIKNAATSALSSALHPSTKYALELTDWKLTRLGDSVVRVGPHQSEPNMILDPNSHRFAGSGGCNRMMGTYHLDGQSLRLGPVAMTMMACPSGMDQEHSFAQALELVRTWKIDGNELEFYGSDSKPIARFEASEEK
jgi:heat shock protein HslJ